MNVKLYIKDKTGEYVDIPLYGDESIRYQSKISDAEDLETVFNDSTNNFSIPATDEANKVFDYWFEIGVNSLIETSNFPGLGTSIEGNLGIIGREQVRFDIKEKIDAYIEINSVPYKKGKVSLTGLDYKDGLPINYKIEFYGSLIELSEKLKDDNLKDLIYLDEYNYKHSLLNYLYSLNQPHLLNEGNIITPLLLLTDRNINISENNNGNITIPEGAITQEELRPAIRIPAIIKAIEKQYNIKFESNFLNRTEVQRMFMWLNNNENSDDLLGWKRLPLDDSFEVNHNFSIGEGTIDYNNATGILTFIRDMRDLHSFRGQQNIPLFQGSEVLWSLSFRFLFRKDTPGDAPVKIRVRNLDTDEIVGETEDWILPLDNSIDFYSNIKLFYDRDSRSINTYRFVIEYISRDEVTIRTSARFNNYCTIIEDTPFHRLDIEEIENTTRQFSVYSDVSIRDNIPDMKVSEFFKGLMDMFRLVITPIEDNRYLIETINEYYQAGNTVDLSGYINKDSHNSNVRRVFRRLAFDWEESDQVLQSSFEREYGRQFGSLEILDNRLEGEKEINLPFSNLMLSPFAILGDEDSALNIGLMQSLNNDGTLAANNKGVFLFYYNGINNLKSQTIYLDIFNVVDEYQYINNIDLVNSDNSSDITNILSWGKEYNSTFINPVETNLYNNYWKNWVDTLYDKDSRLVSFKGKLDYNIINDIALNSRIIIGNNSYNINELNINLTTNEIDITLFPNLQLIDAPYSGSGLSRSLYSFNASELYGTIPLPSFSEWEVTVTYNQGFGWIEFEVDDGVESDPLNNKEYFDFDGRFLNLKVHQNITGSSSSFNRSATFRFIEKNTGEVYNSTVFQSSLLT